MWFKALFEAVAKKVYPAPICRPSLNPGMRERALARGQVAELHWDWVGVVPLIIALIPISGAPISSVLFLPSLCFLCSVSPSESSVSSSFSLSLDLPSYYPISTLTFSPLHFLLQTLALLSLCPMFFISSFLLSHTILYFISSSQLAQWAQVHWQDIPELHSPRLSCPFGFRNMILGSPRTESAGSWFTIWPLIRNGTGMACHGGSPKHGESWRGKGWKRSNLPESLPVVPDTTTIPAAQIYHYHGLVFSQSCLHPQEKCYIQTFEL